jgi:hypothetical protein
MLMSFSLVLISFLINLRFVHVLHEANGTAADVLAKREVGRESDFVAWL